MLLYLHRGLSPLLPLAWLLSGTNVVFPFMSLWLGLSMSVFYCIHVGYLRYTPGLIGSLNAVCGSMVGSLYLWWMQGLRLPPEPFFVILPLSFALHMFLKKRRERADAEDRAMAMAHL